MLNALYDLWLVDPVKVNFLREGCGSDKICQSNLKLSYQFGTRHLASDLFTPLPKLVSDEPALCESVAMMMWTVFWETVSEQPIS